MWRNSEQGYGWVGIALHWLVAIAVFGLFGLGLWMVDLSYYSPWYQQGPAIHKGVGLLLLALVLFRLLWRAVNPSPKAPDGHHRLERLGAKVGHGLLYALLLTLMVSGYLISTADGRPIDVFGLFQVPALITGLPRQEDLAGEVHFYLAWGLIAVAVGHALAALKHHFLDRDTTLVRMLKPTQSQK
ncbi:cytochrome b [Ferrimonas balearica]|uniref:cytochrome b n=1 Tax=Ferrimonas balearica TaxID=44012 RepID=UPI001C996E90|nr:cytochrome b [Ferrimonas balearica]MBY5993671.1 cytochrome b [Ferrimonas balearica]